MLKNKICLIFVGLIFTGCSNVEFNTDLLSSAYDKYLQKSVHKAGVPDDTRPHKLIVFFDASSSMEAVKSRVITGLQNMVAKGDFKKNVKIYVYTNTSILKTPGDIDSWSIGRAWDSKERQERATETINKHYNTASGAMFSISPGITYVLKDGTKFKGKWGDVSEFEELHYSLQINKDLTEQLGIPLELKVGFTQSDIDRVSQDLADLFEAIPLDASPVEESGICSLARVLNDKGPNAIVKPGDQISFINISDENDGLYYNGPGGVNLSKADAHKCFMTSKWVRSYATEVSCTISGTSSNCPVNYSQNTEEEILEFNKLVSATSYGASVKQYLYKLIANVKVIDEEINNGSDYDNDGDKDFVISLDSEFFLEDKADTERVCDEEEKNFLLKKAAPGRESQAVVSECKILGRTSDGGVYGLISDLRKVPQDKYPAEYEQVQKDINTNHCTNPDAPFYLTTNNTLSSNFHLEKRLYKSFWHLIAYRFGKGVLKSNLTEEKADEYANIIKQQGMAWCSKEQVDIEGLEATAFGYRHLYDSLLSGKPQDSFSVRFGSDTSGILSDDKGRGFLNSTFARYGKDNIMGVNIGHDKELDQKLCPGMVEGVGKDGEYYAYDEGLLNKRFSTEMGERGSWGSICESQYDALFSPVSQAIIDSALSNYIVKNFSHEKHDLEGAFVNGKALDKSQYVVFGNSITVEKGLIKEGDEVVFTFISKEIKKYIPKTSSHK